MKYIALLVVLSLIAGCTSRAITMRDPKTGQTVDCGSRSELWAWDVASNPGREESCVRDYQIQGWVRSPNFPH